MHRKNPHARWSSTNGHRNVGRRGRVRNGTEGVRLVEVGPTAAWWTAVGSTSVGSTTTGAP